MADERVVTSLLKRLREVEADLREAVALAERLQWSGAGQRVGDDIGPGRIKIWRVHVCPMCGHIASEHYEGCSLAAFLAKHKEPK